MRKLCGDRSGFPAGHRWISSSPYVTQTLVGATCIVEPPISRLEIVFLRCWATADANAAGLQAGKVYDVQHRVVVVV